VAKQRNTAVATPLPVKRGPGRPRKNPLPAPVAAPAAPAAPPPPVDDDERIAMPTAEEVLARLKARGRPAVHRDRDNALARELQSVSAAMVARMARVEVNAVSQWKSLGCPTHEDGMFDWFAVVEWLKHEGRSALKVTNRARPIDPADGSAPKAGALTYAELDEKYKALSREVKFKREAGLLIEKEEAEKDHLKIALTLRAVLIALPDQIAAQLADLSAIDAGAVLRERMVWLCNQFRDGRVPISPEMEAAVDAVVAQYAPKTLPAVDAPPTRFPDDPPRTGDGDHKP
jgi:hypothetical protein